MYLHHCIGSLFTRKYKTVSYRKQQIEIFANQTTEFPPNKVKQRLWCEPTDVYCLVFLDCSSEQQMAADNNVFAGTCESIPAQTCYSYVNCTGSDFWYNWTDKCCQPLEVKDWRFLMLSSTSNKFKLWSQIRKSHFLSFSKRGNK